MTVVKKYSAEIVVEETVQDGQDKLCNIENRVLLTYDGDTITIGKERVPYVDLMEAIGFLTKEET